jgi:hypothetical protein
MDGTQITQLAEVIEAVWDLQSLELFARDYLDYNLANNAPAGTLRERAYKFISDNALPPRDRILLEALRSYGNAKIQQIANALLAPTYFSPPPSEDPHDAIRLGRAAFIGRPDLRAVIRDFTAPSDYTTRVLIVHGNEPGGKSYSWEFLRHLAKSSAGAEARRLRLENTPLTPREMLEQISLMLDLDPYGPDGMPPLKDDPQEARIDALINWIKGKFPSLQRRYWLVIDDLNHPSVRQPLVDAAYALACSVEEIKPILWVTLLGYNKLVTDPELRYVAKEAALFPDATLVASYFEYISIPSPRPLQAAQAQEYAALLFSKYPELNKESMIKLTQEIENMGSRLRIGNQP